jgi:hypothetical protein
MNIKLFFIGLVFLIVGAFSLYRVYKNPSSDELPYPSHDLSVKIGSLGMAAMGLLFIVSSL